MQNLELPRHPTQGLGLFAGLSADEVRPLTEGAELVRHRHLEVAFAAQEELKYFGIILNGCYKLVKSEGGSTRILGFAAASDPVGLLMMSQPRALSPITVQSLGISSFLRLPRETYLKAWLKSPVLLQRVHAAIAHRCQGFHADRSEQKLSLPQRVAGLLLRCLENQSTETDNLLSFPLSRRDIADAVGSTTESVIRIMSSWEKNGTISTRDQYIQIVNQDRLTEVRFGEQAGFKSD